MKYAAKFEVPTLGMPAASTLDVEEKLVRVYQTTRLHVYICTVTANSTPEVTEGTR